MKRTILFVLAALCSVYMMAQTRVTGTVTSADDGQPIPFATVQLKGTTVGEYTDDNGKYSITVPANGVLIFSTIGFTSQEIPVSGKTVINVALKTDAVALEETIVVAYGTVKKGSYSGAAAVVRGDKIKDVPATSFEQALAGNIAGMQITQNSGQPGSLPEIRIRGISSFNAGNQPLYVIDGIPATSDDQSSANINTSSMNFLNPNDIESITVLKDAAAASLYGSRAANGVILISTKRGKEGKPISTFRASVGFASFAMKNYELTNEAETEMLTREIFQNYGSDSPSVWKNKYASLDEYVNVMTEKYYPSRKPGYEYVNWEDVLFRTAITQNYEYNISGGGEESKVYASLAYSKDRGVTLVSSMKRISATLNAEQKLWNKRITLGANLQFANTNQSGHQEGSSYDNPFWGVKTQLTARWPFKNPDGSSYLGDYNGSTFRNPYPNLDKQIAESKQYRTLLKGFVDVKIIEGLNFKTILSYDNLRVDDRFGWMVGHMNGLAYGNGYIGDRYNKVEKLVSSSTLNFTRTFGENHHVSAMVGWEAEDERRQYTNLSKSDFANFGMTSTYLAATLKEGGTRNDKAALLSFISNVNYDYKNKYYLTGTYRRDGSSRLSAVNGNRWGDFWSVSGSWRVTGEDFMKDVKWLNDLKLRGSYGTSGILPSNLYGYLALYSYDTYGTLNAAYPDNLSNPNLTWEKNYNWNIALDFRLFDRLSITADYYQRRTEDLLLDAAVPSITGFKTSLRNVGSMMNKGVEINVDVNIMKKTNLEWNFGLNWTKATNKILSMSTEGEMLTSRPFIRTAGYSFYQFYTREYAGVDPQTGKVQYYKNTKLPDGTLDKTITNKRTEALSSIIEGKTSIPKGYGGFNTSVKYKGFSASLSFAYRYGSWVWDNATDALNTDGQYPYKNMSREQLDRWQQPGDVTDVPRRTLYPDGGYYDSSRAIKKGDYLRLKNVTLSYSLPASVVNKIKFRGARVYMSASNLFTITGLNFDPETPISGYYNYSIPPLRNFTFGIEFSL